MSRVAIESAFNEGSQPIGGDFNPAQAHALCYLRLEAVDGGNVEPADPSAGSVSAMATKFGDTIRFPCGYVPYIPEGTCLGGTALPKVQLDPHGSPKFVFTGAMNGCSLVIANDAAGNLWGVHYPNSNGEKQGFPMLARDQLVLAKSSGLTYRTAWPDKIVSDPGRGRLVQHVFLSFTTEKRVEDPPAQAQYCAPEGMGFAARINHMLGSTLKGDVRSGVLEH